MSGLREGHDLISTALGSNHVLRYRAKGIVDWIGDPNMHPVEEAAVIVAESEKIHELLVALRKALAAAPALREALRKALAAAPALREALEECDVVPGSLGGGGSIPWCREHGRYASTCEAVRAALAAAPASADTNATIDAMHDEEADENVAIVTAPAASDGLPSVEALTEALHHLHSVELWAWWEPQPDGGALIRRGTSPEFAAAILAALREEGA